MGTNSNFSLILVLQSRINYLTFANEESKAQRYKIASKLITSNLKFKHKSV